MTDINSRTDPADLKPGQYFKNHKVWWLAASTATVHEDGWFTITAWSPRDGSKLTHKFWGTVTDVRTDPPDVFRPASLARRADKLIVEIEEMKGRAARLYALGRELDQAHARAAGGRP